MSYLHFDEAIGEKSLERIGAMVLHHGEVRDVENHCKSQHPAAIKERRIFRHAASRASHLEKTLNNPNISSEDKEKAKQRFEDHRQKIVGVMKRNADKYHLIGTTNQGGQSNENRNSFDTFHHQKVQRRLKAASRLVNYLDKKGYTDDTYLKKNEENLKRADNFRNKHLY